MSLHDTLMDNNLIRRASIVLLIPPILILAFMENAWRIARNGVHELQIDLRSDTKDILAHAKTAWLPKRDQIAKALRERRRRYKIQGETTAFAAERQKYKRRPTFERRMP